MTAHAAEGWLVLLWLLFGGSHVAGSSSLVRPRLIAAMGLKAFKALYSAVAFATFIPLVWVYLGHRHADPMLFTVGVTANVAAQLLMLIAFVVLLQGLLTLNPMSTAAEMSGRYPKTARGIQRVTRHPVNLSFFLFGVAHAIANPFSGDWIFFMGFPIYAVLSAIHQDRRVAATGSPEAKSFIEETSLVPFAACVSGRQRLALRELRVSALVLAAIAFVALRALHPRLLGGVMAGP